MPKESLLSPSSTSVSPLGANAPKDWPPPPVQRMVKVSSGRALPWMRVISEPKMVPSARLVEETVSSITDFLPFWSAGPSFSSSAFSSSDSFRWKSNSSLGSKWVAPA